MALAKNAKKSRHVKNEALKGTFKCRIFVYIHKFNVSLQQIIGKFCTSSSSVTCIVIIRQFAERLCHY